MKWKDDFIAFVGNETGILNYPPHGKRITKSEYLKLTGREPLQRNWKGVRFRMVESFITKYCVITKKDSSNYYIEGKSGGSDFRQQRNIDEVNKNFENGTWIELKEEPTNAKELIADPTYYTPNYLVDAISNIHVERPNTLEDRVKELEKEVEMLPKLFEKLDELLSILNKRHGDK